MVPRFMGILILLLTALTSGVYLASTHAQKTDLPLAVETEKAAPIQAESLPLSRKPSLAKAAYAGSITETLSEEIAKTFNARNPSGPKTIGGIPRITALNPEIIAQGLLKENFSKIVAEQFSPSIDPRTLTIIEADTTASFAAYLHSLKNILDASAPQIQQTLQNPSPYALGTLVPVYDAILADIEKISTPRPLIKIQMEELRLLTIQRNIFAGMANYETDPTLAWAAAELLEPTAEEFSELNKHIESFMQMHKMQF
jgi:hypothetical protein